jgi:hypothetical protein
VKVPARPLLLVIASALQILAPNMGDAPASVSAQAAPAVAPTPDARRVPVLGDAQPLGAPTRAPISPSGGSAQFAEGAVAAQAFPDPARPPLTLVYQGVDARTLPPAQSGLSLGFGAFQLSAKNSDTETPVSVFNVPLNLVIKPGASDLALAQGNIERLHVASWNGDDWAAVQCLPDTTSGSTLLCSTTQPGLFVPLVVLPINPVLDQLDFAVADGHFYGQGNGFGGGGGLGYSVVDDGDAPLWSEFKRQGGTDRLGYPVTNRFLYDGHVTQAFQYGALQWLPELGQSILLNILDELHTHGTDGWLDVTRQVPPAPPDGHNADVSVLAPFPDMLALYEADPNLYGLPVSVRDDGQVATARFQRSTMKVWSQDQPFASSGTVLAGTPGDLAKAAGLWPVRAAAPGAPPAS